MNNEILRLTKTDINHLNNIINITHPSSDWSNRFIDWALLCVTGILNTDIDIFLSGYVEITTSLKYDKNRGIPYPDFYTSLKYWKNKLESKYNKLKLINNK